MNLVLLLIIMASPLITKAELDGLPVLVLDYSLVMTNLTLSPNPFVKISSSDFANIIRNAIMSCDTIVIFVEETLCTEDVTTRDKFGTPFYNLNRGLLEKKVKYLPQVVEPYYIINQIFQQQPLNVLYTKNKGTKRLRFQGNYKYYYVFLENEPKELRTKVLRRHDTIMKEVYTALLEITKSSVIGFYTGIKNPIAFETIKFQPIMPEESPKIPGVMVVSRDVMFRFVDVHITNNLSPTRRSTLNQRPVVIKENQLGNRLSTRMAYSDFQLEFNFNFDDERWTLENVALIEDGREVGQKDMRVSVPWTFSYICADPLVIYNTRDGSTVVITQYQIQPNRPLTDEELLALRNRSRWEDDIYDEGYIGEDDENEMDNFARSKRAFGNTVDCGHCFSASILSGLLVTAVCLVILFYGVASLSSIKANNKFDDPRAKPLFVAPPD